MSGETNPEYETAAPGKLENAEMILAGIDSIVEEKSKSEAFKGVSEDRIRELVEDWFNAGHWWEPSAEELLLFLEGEI